MYFLSICIPAYKRIDYLKRLLSSIAIQSFSDFEVVISDDSNDSSVYDYINNNNWKFSISYFKNETALGTPENWNAAIRQAKGEWIKLMHDDDWFSSPHSLKTITTAIKANPNASFFFSAYSNVYEGTSEVKPMFLKPLWHKALLKDPNILIADNVIGPPSVIVHKNDKSIWYDNQMKYVVDIDFYIRYLDRTKPFYIKETLINVGINSAQVTKYTFNVPEIHLKESLLLLEKSGQKHLHNIIVFDGWWRLIRNFSIRSEQDIRATGYRGAIPYSIRTIMNFQKKIPVGILKIGVFSKLFMSLCYSLYSRRFT